MIQHLRQLLKKNVLLLGILLLASFMRLFRISELVFFGMDQEYQSIISQNIVQGHHFPLIGVNASDTGIYLGPFYSYFAAFIYLVSNGNPVGAAIVSSMIGIIATCVLYYVGCKLASRRVGLIAAFVYGGSFLISFYDRQFWNPNPVPLISIILGYLIIRVGEGKVALLPWLGLVFAIGIQCHLSVFIFTPLILYSIYIQRNCISRSVAVLTLISYVCIQLPWIVFEFRHNFINIRALLDILNGTRHSVESVGILPRFEQFFSTIGRLIWMPLHSDLYLESGQCKPLQYLRKDQFFFGFVVFIGSSAIIWKNYYSKLILDIWKNVTIQFLLGISILSFCYLLLYSRQSFEYYFLYLFPWIAFGSAIIIDGFYKSAKYRYLVSGILSVFISLNILAMVTSTQSFAYYDKLRSLEWAKTQVGDSGYRLEALGGCGRYGGYRYLASYIMGTPKSSYMDSYFGWMYPELIDKKSVVKTVLLDLNDEREVTIPEQNLEEYVKALPTSYVLKATKRFGNISVLIFDPNTFAMRK